MKRQFFDEKKREFVYDSDVPEILPVSDKDDITVQKFILSDISSKAYISVLPENISVMVKSYEDVLKNPALEAYCTPEFWKKINIDEWIQILAQYAGKKDYLLFHTPEKFWENLSVDNWIALLKQNRIDLLAENSHRSSWSKFDAAAWIKLLTTEGSKYSDFFKYCPENIQDSFLVEQWEILLLGNPDYYCEHIPDKYLRKISLEFWIRNICSRQTKLQPRHFPRHIPIPSAM